MNQTFMKEKKVIPLVFSMSMPMVLSMMVNSLFNIVDSYFVAKVSEAAMTALSLVYCFDATDETILDFLRLMKAFIVGSDGGNNFIVYISDNLLVVIVAFVLLFLEMVFDLFNGGRNLNCNHNC